MFAMDYERNRVILRMIRNDNPGPIHGCFGHYLRWWVDVYGFDIRPLGQINRNLIWQM